MKYRFLIIWLSFKSMFKINTGDLVYYKKKKYRVINGTKRVEGLCWELLDSDKNTEGYIEGEKCRKVFTFINCLGSFKTSYNFYMVSWFSIWKNSGIQEWMKRCDIW